MAREGNRADRGEDDTSGEKQRVLNAWRSMLRAGTMAPSRVAVAAPEGRGRPGSAPPTLDPGPEQGDPGEDTQPATEVAQPEATEPPAAEPPEETSPEPEAASTESHPDAPLEPEPAAAESDPDAPPEPEPEPEPEPAAVDSDASEAPPARQAQGNGAHVSPSGPIYGFGDVRQGGGGSRGGRGRVAAVAVVLVGAVVIAVAVAGVFSGDDESDPSGQGQRPPSRAQSPPPPEPRPAPRRAPRAPAAPRVAPWPQGTRAYTVVLFVSPSDRSAAAQRARRAARRGMSAGVLRSDDYSLLEPGYWVTFAGQYRTKAQAQRAVLSAQRRGLSRRPYPVLVNG